MLAKITLMIYLGFMWDCKTGLGAGSRRLIFLTAFSFINDGKALFLALIQIIRRSLVVLTALLLRIICSLYKIR